MRRQGPAQTPGDRDRDARGRPRNARPRDATGRPLPRGAADAGTDPAGTEETPEIPEEALDRAQQLIDSGRPFAAHEVLEAMWKACPAEQQDLWRGLAQLAVGLTHLQRGNRAAAATLLRRGADRLADFGRARPAAGWPFKVDGPAVQAAATALASEIATGGRLPPDALRLPLRSPG